MVIGIISGAESWDSIEEFKNAKIDFLSKCLCLLQKAKTVLATLKKPNQGGGGVNLN